MRDSAASGRDQSLMEFSTPEGAAFTFSRAAAIVHVLTHGVHHRAQCLNMLRRLGRPLTGVDLDPIEWECVQTGQMQM